MPRYTGFYIFRIRYALISLLVVLTAVLLLGYFYLTALVEARTIQAMAWAVEKRVIAIDAGHGGYDPGAKGPSGTEEKDITLQVSRRLAKKLSMEGALVVLLRDTDEDFVEPGPGTKKKRDLDYRLKTANDNGAQLLVSIHVNSYGSKWSGAQTFYNPENKENALLAEAIQAELRKTSNSKRAILPITTSYLLNNLDIPACIVELGFISNPKEEKKLMDPTYQQALAEAIYKGILKYLANQ
ncbi:MAG: N-acetylmuramoyl-L-alanine amidase [Bacillota bacterium]